MPTFDDEGPVPTVAEAREAALRMLEHFSRRPEAFRFLQERIGDENMRSCLRTLRELAVMGEA